MSGILDNYPAERYFDEFEKDEREECKRCKGNCGYIGMIGVWACHGFIPKDYTPKTNADRIRAMTDEELAELLRDTQCNACAWQGNDCDYADECKAEKLEMLKQECDDNGT